MRKLGFFYWVLFIANLPAPLCLYRRVQIKTLQDTWILLVVPVMVMCSSRLHMRARYDLLCLCPNKQTNKQKELKSENIPAVVRECLEAKGSELASCKSQIFCTFYALNLFCSDMCRILCRILSTQISLSKPLCCSFLVCQR